MRDHERRELLVIEENLRAEAPELAKLFDRLPETGQVRRVVGWLAVGLLLLGLALGEGSLLLGGLVLAGMGVIRWTVQADELDRRRR